MSSPFLSKAKRPHIDGAFMAEEVGLSNRNSGMPLEMMKLDITPVGMHYLLSHFDIPILDADVHTIETTGLFEQNTKFTISDLQNMPQTEHVVTMECAGNGRAHFHPRRASMPWGHGAIGTAKWRGVALKDVISILSPHSNATHIVFSGADQGFDGGEEHFFERALTLEEIENGDALIALVMNDMPLLPQHGAPVRLIMPGWFGMASVKWLNKITAIDHEFLGYQQEKTYRYRSAPSERGTGVTSLRPKSKMIPPGIPDWYSRQRLVDAGPQEIIGRAWSGNGVPIEKVEFSVNGMWRKAVLGNKPTSPYAWQQWSVKWNAAPGEHVLSCRAIDAEGNTQPEEPVWDESGFGNNSWHQVVVTVRDPHG